MESGPGEIEVAFQQQSYYFATHLLADIISPNL